MIPSHTPHPFSRIHDDASRFSPTRADQLFRRLDEQRLPSQLGVCRTRVYGVMEEGDDLWVQLSVGGAINASALLRVRLDAEPADALRAVEAWLASGPDEQAIHDRIIEVNSLTGAGRFPSH